MKPGDWANGYNESYRGPAPMAKRFLGWFFIGQSLLYSSTDGKERKSGPERTTQLIGIHSVIDNYMVRNLKGFGDKRAGIENRSRFSCTTGKGDDPFCLGVDRLRQ